MKTSPCLFEGKQGPKASIIRGSSPTVVDQSLKEDDYLTFHPK